MSQILAPPAPSSSAALPSRPAARDPDIVVAVLLVLLLSTAPLLVGAGGSFWMDVLNRVMILAIAATSLNVLIGIGGLISFGHAVYLGLGSYAVGIAAFHGIESGFAQLAIALGASAAFALLTGLVALRTRGPHFIMITLAFAQMAYFLMIGLKNYGGDDGLTLDQRSVFPGIDLENRSTFYYATLLVLVLAAVGFRRLRSSRFGLVLTAAKGNERRVAAVGFDAYRYRLAAYVIAGTVCGLAGFLSANFANFVTPDAMGWTRSGELMFMVILGGVNTVSGPIVGAAVFLLVEQLLGSLTSDWPFWFGLFLVLIVLYARGGLVGLLAKGRVR